MESLPDVFAKLPIWLQWIVAVILALTAIGIPLSTIGRWLLRLPMFNIWPQRKNWIAECIPTPPTSDAHGSSQTDPNNAWKNQGRWTQGRGMLIGDWYSLKLDKPRTLSEITIRSEGPRFPKKIKLLIKESLRIDWNPEAEIPIDVKQYQENTIFNYRFKPHQKVAAIMLQIIEPTLEPKNDKGWSPAWAIYSMDFKEYRLFGCLWETSIN